MLASRRALRTLPALIPALALALPVLAGGHPHKGVLKPYAGKPPKVTLTEADLATLAKGDGVMKQLAGKDGGRGMAIQDIAASTDVVWGRILDFGRYPKMVDNVKTCEVYEKKKDHIKTRFEIGTIGLTYEYFIDHVLNKKAGYMTWTLDYARESDFDDSVGYWFVEQHPTKKGWTRLYYSVDIKLKGWVPGFIQSLLRKEGLKRATAWVKREAEKKAKRP